MEKLLEGVFSSLENGEFQKADEYCERILVEDPKNGQAYLGKLMVERKVRVFEELGSCNVPLEESENFKKSMRFGDQVLRKDLRDLNNMTLDNDYSHQFENYLKKRKIGRIVKTVLVILFTFLLIFSAFLINHVYF